LGANPALGANDVEAILEETAADLGPGGWDPHYGHGRVDAGAAVEAALGWDNQDTTNPSVSFVSPAASATVAGVVTVDLNAQDDVQLASVALYAGGAHVGTDTTAPFSVRLDTTDFADESLRLEAHASDSSGNTSTASRTIIVQNTIITDETPPSVAIHSPSDGATVKKTVSIRATGSDDTAVASMTAYVGGAVICSTAGSDLSCGWNTRRVSAGEYTLSVEAIDTAGHTAMTSVRVTIGSQQRGRRNR